MSTAIELFGKYQGAFTSTLPSHIDADQWASVVYGILNTRPEIARAASNDPNMFLAALLTASRLGLEPGTEEFHLVPFKRKGTPVIQGIVGYTGLIELIYRAGAVASVIVEAVYTGDHFRYAPGRDERPLHEIDWDADDRGKLRLAYAYAVMKDGATSKVVVLNRADIERIKATSQGASSPYSPWNTNEAAMWMKSAARQLAKWVPTSAEYRMQQLRDAQAVAQETGHRVTQVQMPVTLPDGAHVDPLTGEVLTGPASPATPTEVVEAVDAEVVEAVVDPEPTPPLLRTEPQMRKLWALAKTIGLGDADDFKAYLSQELGHPVESTKDLTKDEAARLIDQLESVNPETGEVEQPGVEA